MAPCLCGPGDIVATTPLTSGLTLVTHNENYCGGLTWVRTPANLDSVRRHLRRHGPATPPARCLW